MESPNVSPTEAMTFRVRLRTRWSDEDNHSVLNNAVYLTLFEETRFAFFSGQEQLEANRFPFVLAQVNVVYQAPGRGGAEVEVECATTRVGTTSFTQAYRVRDPATGAVWCEAEARLVCVDPRNGRKAPMSEAFRRAIEGSDSGLRDAR
jgi:YbgC/YbaW family acyl-CoA thioester hydrolase